MYVICHPTPTHKHAERVSSLLFSFVIFKTFTCLVIYEKIKLHTHKKVSSFQNKNVLFVFQIVGTLFGLKCVPQLK